MKWLFIIFLMMANSYVFSQDLSFVQPYSSPLYLNPALAGSTLKPRLAVKYKNQWPASSFNYTTYYVSYDQYLPKIRSGVGFTAYYDRTPDLYTSKVGLVYSPRFIIGNKLVINPGTEFNYIYQTTPKDSWYYSDYRNSFENMDLNAGVLIQYLSLYGGFTAQNLTEPPVGLIASGGANTLRLYKAHLGYEISRHDSSSFALSPQIVLQKQNDFRSIHLGCYAKFSQVVFGVWYSQAVKNSDAFALVLGFKDDHFNLGYSYDITLSKLSNANSGSHEFSLGYLFDSKNLNDAVLPMNTIAF